MRRTTLPATLAVALVTVSLVAAPARAAAPADGCAAGYILTEVAPLAEQGYRVPGLVDSPDNLYGFGHQPGNGDGWVCARELGVPADHVIYQFWDNTLPASG